MSEKRGSDEEPNAGKRPVFATPADPEAGSKVGTGAGYSGQEYDSVGQAEWRREQERHSLPSDGTVEGSGAGVGGGNPGEDYDSDSAAGDGYPHTGASGEEAIIKAIDEKRSSSL
ncbi:hypothetical protein [Sphingomonas sp. 3P27F8]|uniref:hypothetical protein n=1 Tax=Sphingomonas sp. 3P27F8 TaxID=2502213 RepID=UPI0010F72634|nr:hypothetical protein [Sphingomonas sp. 3P27F8]